MVQDKQAQTLLRRGEGFILSATTLQHIISVGDYCLKKLITTGQIRQELMVLTKHCQVEMDSHTGILVEDTELVVTGT